MFGDSRPMSASATDVAVVGVGPYSLSVSASLTATGLEERTFGPPMQTWKAMPKGMCLKSLTSLRISTAHGKATV
jgi:hypothetical protein